MFTSAQLINSFFGDEGGGRKVTLAKLKKLTTDERFELADAIAVQRGLKRVDQDVVGQPKVVYVNA